MDAAIEEVGAAWQWILKSYCLSDDSDFYDKEHYGHGCGYAHGYGWQSGHTHYNENMSTDEYDAIVSYSDDLSLNGINNLE